MIYDLAQHIIIILKNLYILVKRQSLKV